MKDLRLAVALTMEARPMSAEVLLFPTPERRFMMLGTARDIVFHGYEPRTRLDRARTALRRELMAMGISAKDARRHEDQFEEQIRAAMVRYTVSPHPGGRHSA